MTENNIHEDNKQEDQDFSEDKRKIGDVFFDDLTNLFTRKKPVRIFDYFVGIFAFFIIAMVVLSFIVLILNSLFSIFVVTPSPTK